MAKNPFPLGLALLFLAPGLPGRAEELPDGATVARKLNERPRAEHARRRMRLVLQTREAEGAQRWLEPGSPER